MLIMHLVIYPSDMVRKECFKCNISKPLTDFYKHSKMSDGRVGKCKECNKIDVTVNRNKNIEKVRAYDRVRGNRQDKTYMDNYKNNNPKKTKARNMVGNAVRDGKLVKDYFCSKCGRDDCRIYGHHDDYAKPLDVRWLCQACHKQWHAKHGEGLNG